MSVDRFATNPKTNELYSKCEECRPKHAATNNSSANSAAVKIKYKQTEGGQASAKRYKPSDE